MRHESLQVVDRRQPAQVSRHQHRDLFPAEREHESGDQRPLQPCADEREDAAVDREAEREQTEIDEQRGERRSDLAQRHQQEEHEQDGRQHHERRTGQIRQVLAEQHRRPGHRPREQVGDGLVFHFVGDQRRSVKDTEYRHDEPEIHPPDQHAEQHDAADPLAVDGERRAPPDVDDAEDEREQYRRTKHHDQEERAARPEHLAERQVEHARDGSAERGDARLGTSAHGGAHGFVHGFTRYLNTACRLSSGDVTSSMGPALPAAASSVSRV